MQALCVFCGSRTGSSPDAQAAADELGRQLAARRIRLVYGGGNIGLMGILADAVLAGDGEITGVIPEALVNRELAHAGVRDMRIVDSMHTRKALMANLADGFVALPGGIGTFEELFEILTWRQLGIHHKPIALLNVGGYYDPLLAMIERAIEQGFMHAVNRQLLFVADSVEGLIEFLLTPAVDHREDADAIRKLT